MRVQVHACVGASVQVHLCAGAGVCTGTCLSSGIKDRPRQSHVLPWYRSVNFINISKEYEDT